MRLSRVELVGRDLGGQRRFYGEVLGLEAVMQAGRLAVRVGSTRLLFSPAPDFQGEPLAQHFAFNVPPGQFEEAREWVSERAELLPDASGETVFFFQDWNAQMLYFRDADGNILELIARYTLRGSFPELPFGPGSLLGLSEVGVVTPDPGGLAAELEAAGLPRYGETSPDFIPLGDEEGLFIVVREGRPWFPSGEAAWMRPLRVQAQGPRGERVEVAGVPPRVTA